ncbi:hypothetical protein ABID47_006028 [Paenibacillus favisporus]|uniref:ABC transporter permease n=1 Tax=Paenibacillus favisporus TaxID=221028 RepID=A0ABV2FC80_9BACL
MKEVLHNLFIFLSRQFSYIIPSIITWSQRKLSMGRFQDIYVIYGIVISILSFLIFKYNNILSKSLNFGIIIFIVIVLGSVYREILKLERGSEDYFSRMLGWWFATSYFSVIISINLIHIIPYIINLFVFPFYCALYYGIRYLFLRWIRHWTMYFLLFFLMPLISLIIYSFIGMLLFELTNKKIFISDSASKWMVILFCILLINIFVYWTPANRFDEVKVAVYLLLAVFSTISYCFFISDYLAEIITPKLNQISELESITISEVKEFIDVIVKWFSLPYLVGSVFACFTVELVTRNRNARADSR